MKQLHIVQSIDESFGGLGLAALRYSEAVSNAGADVVLFVANRGKNEIGYGNIEGRFSVVGVDSILGRNKNSLISQFISLLVLFSRTNFDVVHLHGVWSPLLFLAGMLAKRNGIPFIISPHGCVEPWALGHRKLKKLIALAVYQRRVFNNASLLIATAKQELDSIRALRLSNPVVVLPNGVDLFFGKMRGEYSFPRKILFLSRVHPKKGIKNLILAWKAVCQPGWKIIIAGPDECDHTAELAGIIKNEGLDDYFEFKGLVVGEEKERCFSEADIFVLPTYSENFGIAVAEALARGLPVITTTGAPWEDLVVHNCGWWVAPDVDSIASALSLAMSLPPSTLAAMGARGVKLVQEKYSWDRIGKVAFITSQWVAQGGDLPSYVEVF